MFHFLCLFLTLIAFAVKEISADRIFGGTNASIEEIPYQVSVHAIIEDKIYFMCSGSIISETVILTTAIWLNESETYNIRYGSAEKWSGGTVLSVKDKIIHEKFGSNGNYSYNIGLLFLSESIKFGKTASSIQLPAPTETVPTGEMVTVSGWGWIAPFQYPRYLQKVSLPMMDKKKCEDMLADRKFHLSPGEFCVGFLKSQGKGACAGDGGGPMVWKGKQYGIPSWHVDFCGTNNPSIYIDVAYFRKWINSTIEKYYSNNFVQYLQ